MSSIYDSLCNLASKAKTAAINDINTLRDFGRSKISKKSNLSAESKQELNHRTKWIAIKAFSILSGAFFAYAACKRILSVKSLVIIAGLVASHDTYRYCVNKSETQPIYSASNSSTKTSIGDKTKAYAQKMCKAVRKFFDNLTKDDSYVPNPTDGTIARWMCKKINGLLERKPEYTSYSSGEE